jgi:hypothetical protein
MATKNSEFPSVSLYGIQQNIALMYCVSLPEGVRSKVGIWKKRTPGGFGITILSSPRTSERSECVPGSIDGFRDEPGMTEGGPGRTECATGNKLKWRKRK